MIVALYAEAERQRDELRRDRQTRKQQNIDRTLQDLRARWPDAFTHPVPLAVGIREQIRAGMPDLPEPRLKMALRHWTRTPRYLTALAEGQPRRNLDGSEAGRPEDAQRDFARLILERRAARRQAASGATPWRAIPPAPETPVAEPPAPGQDSGPGSQLGDGA